MQHEIVGFIIKLIGSFGLWYVGARMVYQNEMERPKYDRVANQTTVAFIAALWPTWLVGLGVAGVAYLIYQFFGGIVGAAFWIIHFFKKGNE